MSFKRTKIGKKHKTNTLNIVGIVAIGLVFIFAVFLAKNINFFKISIDERGLLETNKDKDQKGKSLLAALFGKKDDDKKDESINILIAGRGGEENDAPNLTDTIILLKANTKNKTVSMLSLPRDLYVQFPETKYYGKLNSVYQSYLGREKDVAKGMKMLGQKITDITGEEIDYYINIDFEGFREIVDTLEGIVIDVPNDLIDYEFPDDNWGYRTLVVRKGIWLFDGESALNYVRSRHSTSDFDRSLRQQQVISAIKDKVLSTYLITSPLKIKELYDVFNRNVLTDLPLTKILSLAYSFRNIDEFSIISSNMNDSCFYGSPVCSKGGILYTPDRELFGGLAVLLINGTNVSNLNNYELSKSYANIIFDYPGVQTEDLKINILNSTKTVNLAGSISNDFVKYGFNITKLGNAEEEHETTTIYYNNIGENSQTIEALKLFAPNIPFEETPLPKYSLDQANIEIVLGKDYLMKGTKLFNF